MMLWWWRWGLDGVRCLLRFYSRGWWVIRRIWWWGGWWWWRVWVCSWGCGSWVEVGWGIFWMRWWGGCGGFWGGCWCCGGFWLWLLLCFYRLWLRWRMSLVLLVGYFLGCLWLLMWWWWLGRVDGCFLLCWVFCVGFFFLLWVLNMF